MHRTSRRVFAFTSDCLGRLCETLSDPFRSIHQGRRSQPTPHPRVITFVGTAWRHQDVSIGHNVEARPQLITCVVVLDFRVRRELEIVVPTPAPGSCHYGRRYRAILSFEGSQALEATVFRVHVQNHLARYNACSDVGLGPLTPPKDEAFVCGGVQVTMLQSATLPARMLSRVLTLVPFAAGAMPVRSSLVARENWASSAGIVQCG